MKKRKYITYINSNGVQGFQVKAPLFYNGVPQTPTGHYRSKLFSISHYKNKSVCLKAAIKWRNDYLDSNNQLHLIKKRLISTPDHPRQRVASPRNSSGIIGITLQEDVKESDTFYHYAAYYSLTEGNKRYQRRRSFSVNFYGEKEAFKMACRYRFEMCGTLVMVNEFAVPCRPDVPYVNKTLEI